MGVQMNRQIILKSYPEGAPVPANFALVETPVPEPGREEMLLKTLWLSLDPYMRGRISTAKSYAKPVGIGERIVGGTINEVVKSNLPGYSAGDIVSGFAGWQDFSLSDGTGVQKLDPNVGSLQNYLGVLGMPGLTGYTGLLTIGKPKTGETVVVAAASGPVGSMVGQLAKIKGCRAVGIAGGADKLRYLKQELGFDAAIDHRSPDFKAELAAACPNGIDVYFESVGGKVFEGVLPLLNNFARVPICGLIANYNMTGLPDGPDQLPLLLRQILTKRLHLQGFIVYDFAEQTPDFLRDVGGWLKEGRIRHREDIVEGLENAPDAFIGLLQGKNFGKLLIKVS
jgi:NADPH-dependent curcumin reductase CurA